MKNSIQTIDSIQEIANKTLKSIRTIFSKHLPSSVLKMNVQYNNVEDGILFTMEGYDGYSELTEEIEQSLETELLNIDFGYLHSLELIPASEDSDMVIYVGIIVNN